MYDNSEYDTIFQGHIHNSSVKDNIVTVGGTGFDPSTKTGETTYVILKEKKEGGFEMKTKRVEYDNSSLYYDIKASDMDDYSRNQASSWSKGGR